MSSSRNSHIGRNCLMCQNHRIFVPFSMMHLNSCPYRRCPCNWCRDTLMKRRKFALEKTMREAPTPPPKPISTNTARSDRGPGSGPGSSSGSASGKQLFCPMCKNHDVQVETNSNHQIKCKYLKCGCARCRRIKMETLSDFNSYKERREKLLTSPPGRMFSSEGKLENKDRTTSTPSRSLERTSPITTPKSEDRNLSRNQDRTSRSEDEDRTPSQSEDKTLNKSERTPRKLGENSLSKSDDIATPKSQDTSSMSKTPSDNRRSPTPPPFSSLERKYCVYCRGHNLEAYFMGQHQKFCKYRTCDCKMCQRATARLRRQTRRDDGLLQRRRLVYEENGKTDTLKSEETKTVQQEGVSDSRPSEEAEKEQSDKPKTARDVVESKQVPGKTVDEPTSEESASSVEPEKKTMQVLDNIVPMTESSLEAASSEVEQKERVDNTSVLEENSPQPNIPSPDSNISNVEDTKPSLTCNSSSVSKEDIKPSSLRENCVPKPNTKNMQQDVGTPSQHSCDLKDEKSCQIEDASERQPKGNPSLSKSSQKKGALDKTPSERKCDLDEKNKSRGVESACRNETNSGSSLDIAEASSASKQKAVCEDSAEDVQVSTNFSDNRENTTTEETDVTGVKRNKILEEISEGSTSHFLGESVDTLPTDNDHSSLSQPGDGKRKRDKSRSPVHSKKTLTDKVEKILTRSPRACQLCKNHQEIVLLKGHKTCPRQTCECKKCQRTREHRRHSLTTCLAYMEKKRQAEGWDKRKLPEIAQTNVSTNDKENRAELKVAASEATERSQVKLPAEEGSPLSKGAKLKKKLRSLAKITKKKRKLVKKSGSKTKCKGAMAESSSMKVSTNSISDDTLFSNSKATVSTISGTLPNGVTENKNKTLKISSEDMPHPSQDNTEVYAKQETALSGFEHMTSPTNGKEGKIPGINKKKSPKSKSTTPAATVEKVSNTNMSIASKITIFSAEEVSKGKKSPKGKILKKGKLTKSALKVRKTLKRLMGQAELSVAAKGESNLKGDAKTKHCCLCGNHGVIKKLAGHKGNCEYVSCTCAKCSKTIDRRRQDRLKKGGRRRSSSASHDGSSNDSFLNEVLAVARGQCAEAENQHVERHQSATDADGELAGVVAADANKTLAAAADPAVRAFSGALTEDAPCPFPFSSGQSNGEGEGEEADIRLGEQSFQDVMAQLDLHIKEEIVSCMWCGDEFASNTSLEEHAATHEQPNDKYYRKVMGAWFETDGTGASPPFDPDGDDVEVLDEIGTVGDEDSTGCERDSPLERNQDIVDVRDDSNERNDNIAEFPVRSHAEVDLVSRPSVRLNVDEDPEEVDAMLPSPIRSPPLAPLEDSSSNGGSEEQTTGDVLGSADENFVAGTSNESQESDVPKTDEVVMDTASCEGNGVRREDFIQSLLDESESDTVVHDCVADSGPAEEQEPASQGNAEQGAEENRSVSGGDGVEVDAEPIGISSVTEEDPAFVPDLDAEEASEEDILFLAQASAITVRYPPLSELGDLIKEENDDTACSPDDVQTREECTASVHQYEDIESSCALSASENTASVPDSAGDAAASPEDVQRADLLTGVHAGVLSDVTDPSGNLLEVNDDYMNAAIPDRERSEVECESEAHESKEADSETEGASETRFESAARPLSSPVFTTPATGVDLADALQTDSESTKGTGTLECDTGALEALQVASKLIDASQNEADIREYSHNVSKPASDLQTDVNPIDDLQSRTNLTQVPSTESQSEALRTESLPFEPSGVAQAVNETSSDLFTETITEEFQPETMTASPKSPGVVQSENCSEVSSASTGQPESLQVASQETDVESRSEDAVNWSEIIAKHVNESDMEGSLEQSTKWVEKAVQELVTLLGKGKGPEQRTRPEVQTPDPPIASEEKTLEQAVASDQGVSPVDESCVLPAPDPDPPACDNVVGEVQDTLRKIARPSDQGVSPVDESCVLPAPDPPACDSVVGEVQDTLRKIARPSDQGVSPVDESCVLPAPDPPACDNVVGEVQDTLRKIARPSDQGVSPADESCVLPAPDPPACDNGVGEVQESTRKIARPARKMFPCTECDRKFTTKKRLSVHRISEHALPRAHVCDVCKDEMPSSLALEVHTNTVHAACPAACPSCPASFTSALLRDAHAYDRHDARELTFTCPSTPCRFSADSPSALTCHVQEQHPGTGPFGCTICGAYFESVETLGKHHDVHLEALSRGGRCEFCSAWFPSAELLGAHILDQHDRYYPRAYRCPKCDDEKEVEEYKPKFHKLKNLSAHVAYEHPDDLLFKCAACDTRFRELTELQLHTRDATHLPSEMMFCPPCEMSSLDVLHMRDHVDVEHMDLVPLERTAQLFTLMLDAIAIQ